MVSFGHHCRRFLNLQELAFVFGDEFSVGRSHLARAWFPYAACSARAPASSAWIAHPAMDICRKMSTVCDDEQADPPQELGVAVGLQHGHPPVAHGHLKADHGRQDGRIAKANRERHTERGQHETESGNWSDCVFGSRTWLIEKRRSTPDAS